MSGSRSSSSFSSGSDTIGLEKSKRIGCLRTIKRAFIVTFNNCDASFSVVADGSIFPDSSVGSCIRYGSTVTEPSQRRAVPEFGGALAVLSGPEVRSK